MGQPVRRVLSYYAVTSIEATIIHLRTPLPTPSSSLPGHSGEQPSNVPCLALLPVGFTLAFPVTRKAVVSYTAVSPLPLHAEAVYFLWHWPAGYPEWVLPTTVLFGARTFLGLFAQHAIAQLPHPTLKSTGSRRERSSVAYGLCAPEQAEPGSTGCFSGLLCLSPDFFDHARIRQVWELCGSRVLELGVPERNRCHRRPFVITILSLGSEDVWSLLQQHGQKQQRASSRTFGLL